MSCFSYAGYTEGSIRVWLVEPPNSNRREAIEHTRFCAWLCSFDRFG